MLTCPQCARQVLVSDTRCSHCGLSLSNLRSVDDVADQRHSRNRRKLWIGHGIVGIMVVAGIAWLMSSLGIILSLIYGVVVGFPMGFLISYNRAGSFKGMLIGSLVCSAFFQIAILCQGGGITAWSLFCGVMSGAIPGYVIGLHCETDR